MGDSAANPSPDRAAVAIAARQHGIVTSAQLAAAGLGPNAIAGRVAKGWLRRIAAGVYAVGHSELTLEAQWMAGVLAGGRGAVLSHRSALMLWRILPRQERPVEVTVPASNHARSRRRLVVHQSRNLAGWWARRDGIPVTKPARALIDFGEDASRRALERALDEADRRAIVRPDGLREALAAHPGRGSKALRVVLEEHAVGTTATANDFEERFLALCDRYGLPRPLVNVADGHTIPDFRWPAQRVIVETDGRGHMAAAYFEGDRVRDVTRTAEGWRVLRFTWKALIRRPAWVAEQVAATLELAGIDAPQSG